MYRKRIGLAAAGLILVACAAFGPGMLDWNRYRDSIASLAAQQLGRPVTIGGGISLTLLPQPMLTADDIAVEDAGDGIGLRARALRLRVALVPLLGGKVDARELVLQGADLRLPWPPPAGAVARRPPSWLTGLQARIEDGRLRVGDLAFSGLDARIETDPDTGTLSAAGTGQAGARTWAFSARLGRPGGDGAAALDVALDGQGPLRDTGGTFSGALGADGALSGRVAGRGPDLSLLMPAPALPWRGDGRLSATGGLAIADELSLEIGGAPARGAVALRVTPSARLDLSIAAGRLDLDAWVPALLVRGRPTLRAGIPTGIDLSAEAATLAGGLVRQLRGAIDLDSGAIKLRDVAAVLPGEARLALAGHVETTDQPRFDGTVQLMAPDLRTSLRWLERAVPFLSGLPPTVLRTADMAGHVTADANGVAVSDLHGSVDGGGVSGSAAVRRGARPRVDASLALDRVDLAAWLPDVASNPSAQLAALRAVDADVRLQAKATQWGAVSLGPALLEVQADAVRVAVRRLEAQPLGARLTASGSVGEGGRLADGRLDLVAPDLGALQPLLASIPDPLWGAERLLRGAGSLSIQAAGPPDALTGRIQAELGDLRLDLRPTINVAARHWAGAVTLHHPGAPRLLEALGLGGTASWLGDGSLSLVGQMAAAPGRVELNGATLTAGSLRMTGRIAVVERHVTGQLSAESLPLPFPYVRSPDPLPLAALRGWGASVRLDAAQVLVGLTQVLQAATADLALEDGVLRITQLTAQAEGGSLSGAVTVDAAVDPPRLAVSGSGSGLSLTGRWFGTPLDLVAGQVDATVDLSADGYSPAALLATLGGRASIRVRDGVAEGFDLAAVAAAANLSGVADATEAARGALLSGSTPFSTVDAPATLARGVAKLDAAMASTAGEAKLSGSVDLVGGTMDLRLIVRPGPDAPDLGERVAGTIADPTRAPELAGLARWLAERPTQ